MPSRIPIRIANSQGSNTSRQNSSKIVLESADDPKTSQALLGNEKIEPDQPELGVPCERNEQENPGAQEIPEVVEIGTGIIEIFGPVVLPPPTPTPTDSDTEIQAPEETPTTGMPTYIQRLTELRELEVSHYRGDDRFKWKHHLDIPRHLIFSCDERVKTKFHGVITLDNKSKLNITYWIQSYSHSKFRFGTPAIGLIAPKTKREIKVWTRRSVRSLGDLNNESFMVLATPIFHPGLKKVSCLKVYWKVFGSDWFPVNMAESHCIDILIPEESTGNFSMMDLMATFPNWRNKYNFEAMNTSEFYTAWEIYGGDWDKNYSLDKQYQQYLRNTKVRRNKFTKSHLIWAAMMVCFILAACLYFYERIDEVLQDPDTVWYEADWLWECLENFW